MGKAVELAGGDEVNEEEARTRLHVTLADMAPCMRKPLSKQGEGVEWTVSRV
ncbi:unnamed protein product, partial [Urochloa humidicola]